MSDAAKHTLNISLRGESFCCWSFAKCTQSAVSISVYSESFYCWSVTRCTKSAVSFFLVGIFERTDRDRMSIFKKERNKQTQNNNNPPPHTHTHTHTHLYKHTHKHTHTQTNNNNNIFWMYAHCITLANSVTARQSTKYTGQ